MFILNDLKLQVGMAATLASVCSVPLTSVLLLFELTKDYTILLPLMVNFQPGQIYVIGIMASTLLFWMKATWLNPCMVYPLALNVPLVNHS